MASNARNTVRGNAIPGVDGAPEPAAIAVLPARTVIAALNVAAFPLTGDGKKVIGRLSAS